MKNYGKLLVFLVLMFSLIIFLGILLFVSLFSAVDTVMVVSWASTILGLSFVAFTGFMAERSTESK